MLPYLIERLVVACTAVEESKHYIDPTLEYKAYSRALPHVTAR